MHGLTCIHACARWQWVYALKRDFPHLHFSLNGGVQSCHHAAAFLQHDWTTIAASQNHLASINDNHTAHDDDSPMTDLRTSSGLTASSSEGEERQGGVKGNKNGEGAGLLGVMIGRAAYNMVWDCLSDADRAVFGAKQNAAISRRQVRKIPTLP